MTYAQYLNTEYWFNKTCKIKAERGNKCAICCRTEADLPVGSTINLHHIDKNYHRGREADDDLQLLCTECHTRLHERQITPFPNGVYDFIVDSVENRTSRKGETMDVINLIVYVDGETKRCTEWLPSSFYSKRNFFLDSIGIHDSDSNMQSIIGLTGRAYFVQKMDDSGRVWNNVQKWMYKE